MAEKFTTSWYMDRQAKERAQKHADDLVDGVVAKVERESKLHERIIDFCNSQWPRWKYIRARMDKKSTIQVGSQDFTIFASGSRTFCFECKREGEKRTDDQLIWAKEMEMLGFTVHCITRYEHFLETIQ